MFQIETIIVLYHIDTLSLARSYTKKGRMESND